MSISSAVIACFFHKREYPAALNTQPLIHLSRALLAVPLYSLLYLPAVTAMVGGWWLAAILRDDEKAARAMHGEVEIIIKARVTIEKFWVRSRRELDKKRARTFTNFDRGIVDFSHMGVQVSTINTKVYGESILEIFTCFTVK